MMRNMTAALSLVTLAGLAQANPLNLGWVDVSSLPPAGPVGAPTNGPTNVSAGSAPADPQPGELYYYQIDNGVNADSNGGSASHFEVEGVANGSFVGQSWLQWNGLIDDLTADADAAFGEGGWTINRVWMVIDEASFSFGDTGGCVAVAETTDIFTTVLSTDFGSPTSGCVQTVAAQGIPVGFGGHVMTATAGAPTNQTFMLYNRDFGPDVLSGSLAFQVTEGGADFGVTPASNDLTLYLAPNDDFFGGIGSGVALSFDGFLAGNFGFSPQLIFEVTAFDAAPPPPALEGDLNGDDVVDSTDLNFVLGDFGCTGGDCEGDADGDGDTDSDDLNVVLGNFGASI